MKKNKRVRRTILKVFIIVCFLSTVVDMALLWFSGQIEIVTEERQVLNIGEYFLDTTTANFRGYKNVSKYLKTEGHVDTNKIGTYELRYFCFGQRASRKVDVQDLEAPVLELLGDEVEYSQTVVSYKEPGVKAIDNVDGDISKNIKERLYYLEGVNYYIIYSVEDSAGNYAEIKRWIVVGSDPTANGTSSSQGYIPSRTVYLTFDDGPSSLTSQYLDVLKEHHVNATFFVLGFSEEEKEWKTEIMKRALEEGNQIGLHGFSHEYSSIYSSVEKATMNFINENQLLQGTLGINSRIIRFPGGASNTVSRMYCEGVMSESARILLESGYSYFDWNVDSNDAGSDYSNSDAIYQNVLNGVISGRNNVVLLHDSGGHEATLEALPKIIEELQSRGYSFEVITEETLPVRHPISN